MEEHYATLNVEEISFDTENPRIKIALEKYGGKINAERIYFALRSASGNGTGGTSSYNSLRDSILANGGAKTPVDVAKIGDKYVCIDGNTRLAIYKQFSKEGVTGNWSKIKVRILENATKRDIETIRVCAHLVGAREWPAYEKARYLHYLRHENLMDYGEMVALCGGNKVSIERDIDAFHDMNEYYRDVVDDAAFKIDRFSGFVELQKRGIKQAIFEAGLDLKNFGEWIRDGKIYRLESVRDLPKVLRHEEAKAKFLTGGPRSIEEAVKLLEGKDAEVSNKKLERASAYDLARVLVRRIDELPFSELESLKNKENEEAAERVNVLENLSERLHKLLENVSE